jgi:pimeloyl-ACP methyl ester carboxylesterase
MGMITTRDGADPSVVLVHGAYADGSSWSEVIRRLQAAGITVTAVQNPLTSLPDDVAHTRRVLEQQPRAVVLAGHSFAGTVITEAGTHPKVAALVYVAARAPDVGEDWAALAGQFPAPPASSGVIYVDGFGALTEEAFLRDFANGVEPGLARVLYAVQGGCRRTSSGTGQRPPPGVPGRPGTPSLDRTGRSPPSSSGSWPSACGQRRSRLTPAICRWSPTREK